jgi:hypothetical protein
MKKTIVFRSGSLTMGGLERILIEVLQNIDKEKYNVVAIIENDLGDENIFLKDVPKEIMVYFLKTEEIIHRTKYHRVRKKNIINKIMYNFFMAKERVIELRKMKEILKKIGKVDIFIDFDCGGTKYIDKLDVGKKIVWCHGSIPKVLGDKTGKLKRNGENLKKYDTIVTICDEMKEETKRIYPFLKDKVIRIYNPFNFDRILTLSTDDKDLTEQEKELMKEKYIVAVSRLDMVQKDYGTLIKAFKLLKERGVKEKLYIVGDGPGRDEIQTLIDKNNLLEDVKLIGQTKNPYIWMKNSELFVHSSNYEGLPTVLIEALILNKVVVSSDCPTGPKEILKNGECGFLYEIGDYKKLEEQLYRVLKDKLLSDEFKKISVERIEEFKVSNIMKEYEALIEN